MNRLLALLQMKLPWQQRGIAACAEKRFGAEVESEQAGTSLAA